MSTAFLFDRAIQVSGKSRGPAPLAAQRER